MMRKVKTVFACLMSLLLLLFAMLELLDGPKLTRRFDEDEMIVFCVRTSDRSKETRTPTIFLFHTVQPSAATNLSPLLMERSLRLVLGEEEDEKEE